MLCVHYDWAVVSDICTGSEWYWVCVLHLEYGYVSWVCLLHNGIEYAHWTLWTVVVWVCCCPIVRVCVIQSGIEYVQWAVVVWVSGVQ